MLKFSSCYEPPHSFQFAVGRENHRDYMNYLFILDGYKTNQVNL